jgi:hypothetical protein
MTVLVFYKKTKAGCCVLPPTPLKKKGTKVISCRVVNEPNCSITTGVGLEKILFISVNLENELNSHPSLDSAIK